MPDLSREEREELLDGAAASSTDHFVLVQRALDALAAAEQERDRLGNELAQERAKPGGSWDEAAVEQRIAEAEQRAEKAEAISRHEEREGREHMAEIDRWKADAERLAEALRRIASWLSKDALSRDEDTALVEARRITREALAQHERETDRS